MLRAGSELKARFPGGVGKGFHPAVIQVAATIEDHLLDALGQGTLGDEFADGNGSIAGASCVLEARAQVLVKRRGRAERALCGIVDDLGVDVAVGAKHSQPGTVGGAAEMATQAPVALLGLLFAREGRHGGLCGGVSGGELLLA